MKVKDLVIKEKTSSKGNTYKALYVITEDGKEIFVCFVNVK